MAGNDKAEAVAFTEDQMILLMGIGSRGQMATVDIGASTRSLIAYQGKATRPWAEGFLIEYAQVFEAMATNLRAILAEITENGLVSEDAIAEVEKLFGQKKKEDK